MNHHLVILKPAYLDLILSGRKTVECRCSLRRVAPFGKVRRGDHLWLKAPSAAVRARAVVRQVQSIVCPSDETRQLILREYQTTLRASPQFQARLRTARYLTFLHLGNVRAIAPRQIAKKDRRGWVVLKSSLDLQ